MDGKLQEALCGEAGASSPRALADACWVLRVGWKIGVLLQEDDSEADAQELRKFFTLLDSVQRASVEVRTNIDTFLSPRAFAWTYNCVYITTVLVSMSSFGVCRSRACTHRDSS